MKIENNNKRKLLKGLLLATLTLFSAESYAQDYPNKTVNIIVPAAPGGTTDLTARLLADQFQKSLGQAFVVENVGGASGNIGNARVANAAPDGYTLLLAYSGYQVTNTHIFKNAGWDALKSYAPIANAIKAPHVLVVKKSLPVTDLKSLIAYAKANNGKLNYGSAGIGSIQHIGGEQLKQLGGFDMTHVPYRGAGPAMNDLIAGNIDLFITTPPSAVGHIQAGTISALALAADKRHPVMPNVPTAEEAGLKGYELVAWFALYAPANTPKAIIDKLAAATKAAVASKEFQDKANAAGAYASYLDPEELGAFTKSELEYWGNVIRKANIKAE